MSEAMKAMVTSYQKRLSADTAFLDELQLDAANDSNFANPKRADHWTVKEVCFWLSQIHLDKYITAFRDQIIDGSILVRDLNESMLLNDLGVKRLHVNKLMREIKKLRAKSKMNDGDPKDEIIRDLRREVAELKEANVRISSQLISTIPTAFNNKSRTSFLQ